MSKDNKKIFISYRRSASQYFARSVFQHLYYNGHDAFFDIESVGPGEFELIILNQIKARAHFLAILAPGSLERLENPDDWLRKEIECALDKKRNVIPVLHGGFNFATHGKQLTGKLAQLIKLQALRIHDDYFNEGMERLANRYLQQPFYGQIVETPVKDEPEVERRIAEAQEEEKPTEAELSAEEYFNKGYEANEKENHQEAIGYYTLAIEKKADHMWAFNNRGYAYNKLTQHDQALPDLDRAIQLDPQNAKPYNNRGISYDGLKQHEHAIQDYNKAITLDPQHAVAYNNRGGAYGDLKQYERAMDDFDKAIELDPKYVGAIVNRGITYGKLEQYGRAIEDFDRAIELDPQDAITYNNRGVVYDNLEQYARAIEDFKKALEINPDYELAKINLRIAKEALASESKK